MKRALGLVMLAALAGCGRPPRPAIMADADVARQTPAAHEASDLAPEAFAHAEKLRRDAETAYQNDQPATTQVLAEHALAAYDHALVLARIARATKVADLARAELSTGQAQLSKDEAELARVTAEADDLETKVKVVRDAAPIALSKAVDGQRDDARLAAARSLALDARLLCAAARMLSTSVAGLADAESALGAVDQQLVAAPHPAPIDAATRARARCLAVLTAARRPAGTTSSLGVADALLAELAATGDLAPLRDDRGVVVTLRGLFQGTGLAHGSDDKLRALGRVAAAHPTFPVEIVVHAATPKGAAPEPARDRSRGEAVGKALVAGGAGAEHLHIESAGASKPLVDPIRSKDVARNERVEIVFVNPGG